MTDRSGLPLCELADSSEFLTRYPGVQHCLHHQIRCEALKIGLACLNTCFQQLDYRSDGSVGKWDNAQPGVVWELETILLWPFSQESCIKSSRLKSRGERPVTVCGHPPPHHRAPVEHCNHPEGEKIVQGQSNQPWLLHWPRPSSAVCSRAAMPVTVICSYRKYIFLAIEKISSANNIWFMLAIFLIFFYWTWSHNIYYHSALNHQDTLSGYSKPRQNQELDVNIRCKFRHYARFSFKQIKVNKCHQNLSFNYDFDPNFCHVMLQDLFNSWVSALSTMIISWLTRRSINSKFSQYLEKSTTLYLYIYNLHNAHK